MRVETARPIVSQIGTVSPGPRARDLTALIWEGIRDSDFDRPAEQPPCR